MPILFLITRFPLAGISYYSSRADILSISGLQFSPFKLILLIAWVYLCLYCVQKVQLKPTLTDNWKLAANLATLFTGPIVLLFLAVLEIRRKSRHSNQSLIESIKEYVYDFTERVSALSFSSSSSKSTIKLLDLSGKSLKEVYGHNRIKSQDRHILDLTEQIILNALEEKASDILIDPKSDSIHTVRFRVDGILRLIDQFDSDTCGAVINSIKAISGMDIAERRRPQDGAFVAKSTDCNISFRVASAGVLNGEKLSIRILNQSSDIFQLENIGLTSKQRLVIEDVIERPSGMILMCGPTGSGKTTTLYAILNKIDLFRRNVITVEDPIEYVLPNASQIEVNPKADITFAKSLRSILRQDPDVICVGEIRDEETAKIALSASQTGHLVLATIHSNSPASALIRLLDLGVTPMMLSTGLSLIISQRLIRKLCDNCKVPAQLDPSQIAEFRKSNVNYRNMCEPNGCKRCGETGYLGRIGVYDVLVMDTVVKAQVLNDELAIAQLRKEGDKKGKSNLKKQSFKKAVLGLTSLEELKRVIG